MKKRTKKPKGKQTISQTVVVNVSKRASKPRGPPQPSQAERLFQLMAQQQRLLQPAQPMVPSLSQLQQLLKPSAPIIIQGIQGPQGPQGLQGPQGIQPVLQLPSYPTLSTPIQVEPLPEALVKPQEALIDTTARPVDGDKLSRSGETTAQPEESEDEEKYEEKKKKRPTLKKPDPGEEVKAVSTDTTDWMSLFTQAGDIDVQKLQKLPEKRKANTTAPITLREVAKTLNITVPRDKSKADVVGLILDYYRGASKAK